MKTKMNWFGRGAMLALLVGAFGITLLAQDKHQDMMNLGKKGEIVFDSSVRVGDQLLKEGTYQIQHVMNGEDHIIVFRKMSRDSLSQLITGKEIARVKCRVEPLGEKAKHSGIRFGTNAAGEKTVEDVHMRGESVKHLL
jgi:hypothetical protein